MTTTTPNPPGDDAAVLLADVQKQALRGMVWAIIAFCPVQLYVWHSQSLAQRTTLSLTFEAVLLAGVTAQYLSLDRLSVRGSGILFVSWLGIIDVLAWLTTGPLMATGIALVCTSLTALFFINKRAGATVVLGFGVLVVAQALLISRGLLAPYTATADRPLATLLRSGLSNFAVLAVGYACFAMIHHALFRALGQAETERKNRTAAEQTMRANQHFEALGKLTSGVAHDVNNALTTVLGNAELLKFSLPPGEEQAFANDIITAARSAAQTTRHLLSLNRHEFCQPVSTDPAEVATSVSRIVGRLMPDNIRLTLEPRSRRRILVDPADLQQALLNLLLNARDALPAGGHIVLGTADGPDAQVTLTLADNGTGIPPAVLPRIFDPFFTTKSAGKGTGLGLAMVRAFAEEAGGQVTAQNHPGGGACFTLTFPACTEPAPEAADGRAPGPEVANRRILLIEDQAGLRSLMDRVLQRGGHQVTAVASADEALAQLARADFDLLCTDGIFGSTPVTVVIAAYRRLRPAAPVLLCSGHADQELLGAGIATLGADLLRKPFTGTELLARVHRTLQQSAPGPHRT